MFFLLLFLFKRNTPHSPSLRQRGIPPTGDSPPRTPPASAGVFHGQQFSQRENTPAQLSLSVTAFFESSLLLQRGLLQGPQMDVFSTSNLWWLQGLCLSSCHGPKRNGRSKVPSLSSLTWVTARFSLSLSYSPPKQKRAPKTNDTCQTGFPSNMFITEMLTGSALAWGRADLGSGEIFMKILAGATPAALHPLPQPDQTQTQHRYKKTFSCVTICITAKKPNFSGCTPLLTSPNLLYWQKRWKERGSSGSIEAATVTTNVEGTNSSWDQPCALTCSLLQYHCSLEN